MTPEAVVVLGAETSAPGIPGPALRRRLAHGVRVLAERNAEFLVVSGGTVGPPPSEAIVMQRLALEQGVSADRIILEDRATNTFENAVFVGRFIHERNWQRVVVVTDSFHLPRALVIFRWLGLPAAGDAVPGRSGLSRPKWAGECVREFWALLECLYLFLVGRHKPIVQAEWRR